MRYHITAFLLGFLLDLCLGDPHFLPHPVQFIGALIQKTEKRLRRQKEKTDKGQEKREQQEQKSGVYLVVIVLLVTGFFSAALLGLAYWIHVYAGTMAEAVMTWQILAAKSLRTESMKVWKALKNGNLEKARRELSMIVGRDTDGLLEEGIIKAAVETVAENTSDGVIAPMVYTALGGPVLGFLYKAVNTMDSMVGYKNDTYLHFGRAAAKLDDIVNYIPARLGAYLMIAAAFLGGKNFSGRHAFVVFRRDRFCHASPNSAQTESACAGALGIRLSGDASYFGKIVKKPYIGDALRPVSKEDIKLANLLMYRTAWLGELLCLLLLISIGIAGGFL